MQYNTYKNVLAKICVKYFFFEKGLTPTYLGSLLSVISGTGIPHIDPN